MQLRDELTILKQAAEKAIRQGWQPSGRDVLSVDYTLEPPSIVLHVDPIHQSDNNDVYLSEYFPLFENSFAISYWGHGLEGDSFFGTLPAWMYHQHRLLSFLQYNEHDAFFNYLALYL